MCRFYNNILGYDRVCCTSNLGFTHYMLSVWTSLLDKVNQVRKINPIAKSMLQTHRRRASVVPDKTKYNRKKDANHEKNRHGTDLSEDEVSEREDQNQG